LTPRPLAAARLINTQLSKKPVNLAEYIHSKSLPQVVIGIVPEKGNTRDGAFFMGGA
jgi:hypothetical protein